MSRCARRVFWLMLLAIGLASCRKPTTAALGEPLALPVNQVVTFRKSDLDLRFRRVVSDNRCPTGVECIVAGKAVVTLEARILKGAVESFDVELPAGPAPDSGIWTRYDGYRIRLVKLEPYPAGGIRADTTSYVGTFVVESVDS